MARARPPARPPWRPNRLALGLALAVGAGLPLLWAWSVSPPAAEAVANVPAAAPTAPSTPAPTREPAAPATPQVAIAAPAPAPPAARQIPRLRDPEGDPTPDLADHVNPGEVPTMAEVISRLRAAGVTGGLAAFNPPGTKPPLEGNAVADDAELPPGYVRHHQFTDDGQRIEPILLYSPEHPLVVAALQAAGSNAASLQARDLVVPASALPAGIPVRRAVVPPPAEPGK